MSQRSLAPFVFVALGLLIGLAVGSSRLDAQPRPRPRATWDQRCELLGFAGSYQSLRDQANTLIASKGDDGWELAEVLWTPTSYLMVCFKRPTR